MAQMLYVIVGYPVGQVRSPKVFNSRFESLGIDAVMIPLEVEPERLSTTLEGLHHVGNFGGAIITVPHKVSAAAIGTLNSRRVELVGAANVMKPFEDGWKTDLFDGIGFIRGMQAASHKIVGSAAAVVGSGGAGVAIAESLLSEGARVCLSDIDGERAQQNVVRLQSVYPGQIECGTPDSSHEIVVNATPVGMGGDDRMPFDPAILNSRVIVAEAIMKPVVTPLLRKAAELGLMTHEGRHMLDGQVDAIWSFLQMSRVPGDGKSRW